MCKFCKLINKYNNGYRSGEDFDNKNGPGNFALATNPDGEIFINYLYEDDMGDIVVDDSANIIYCPYCGGKIV